MLWTGGVDANVYELDDKKILVGIQKGMYIDDLQRFLQAQGDEVQEYEWNGQSYSAKQSAARKINYKKEQSTSAARELARKRKKSIQKKRRVKESRRQHASEL